MRIYSPQEIGILVRQQRKNQHLSQEELAQRIGASRQWVRMLEQGKPRLELGLTLRALAALELSVEIQEPTSTVVFPTPAVVHAIVNPVTPVVSIPEFDLDQIIDDARRPYE